MKTTKKAILIVMDGWGISDQIEGNAIKQAKTPHFDTLWNTYPHTKLECSGESVGLPDGQMGTSEVNHLTIGAGRVLFQDLVRVNKSIKDKSFFNNHELIKTCAHVNEHGSALHIMGLVSDGGVHSHIEHLKAVITLCKQQKVKKVYIHVFTDGRDTGPRSSLKYIQELEDHIAGEQVGEIVTLVGRYYGMDRDSNMDRTQKAYDLIAHAKGAYFESTRIAIQASHHNDITDEYIEPVVLMEGYTGIKPHDGVIFFNFRTDRPRQLMSLLLEHAPEDVHITTMTQYHPDYPVHIAYKPVETHNSLGETLSKNGKKQLRLTETEKFAHLTYFLNCKKEYELEGEDRVMLDSYSDIKTHDERPQMRTPDITKHAVAVIKNETYDVIFINICNCDMVGHTGNIEAAIQGAEATDMALGKITKEALKHGYVTLITADHGNAEEMLNIQTGEMITSHSTNPVPFILVDDSVKKLKKDTGTLIDIAPTILQILSLETPENMTGTSFY